MALLQAAAPHRGLAHRDRAPFCRVRIPKQSGTEQDKPLSGFRFGGMIWAGLSFSALYWLLESVRDVLVFGKGAFFHCLLPSNPLDIATRIMAVCVLLLFAAYAQIFLDDRQRIGRALRETCETLEQMTKQRTEELMVSNERLKQEIAERAKAEEQLRTVNSILQILSNCNEIIVRSSDEETLLSRSCEKILESGAYALVWIEGSQDNKSHEFKLKAQAVCEQADSELLEILHHLPYRKDMPAMEVSRTVVIEDISVLSLDSSLIPKIQQGNLHSWIRIPLKSEEKVTGMLNIVSRTPRFVNDQEVLLLEKLANDLAFGLTALKVREQHDKNEREKELIRDQLFQGQKMEAIGILAGGVAHDFNNLLTAIQVSVDLAMMEVQQDSSVYRELNEIHQVAGRASDLARQLLLFSQKHPMEPGALKLNDVVQHLHKMLVRITGESISIQNESDSGLWHVWADRSTIEQVIVNLAVNARDAMKDGGTLTIQTRNQQLNETKCKHIPESRPGRYVRLTVQDTGTGMPDEILPRVFEPFYSTKSPGKGAGLGLSVVYGIIKEHEGFVQVISEVGKGTVIHIFLPAICAMQEFDRDGPVSFNELQGHGKRILIVEDEDIVREYTCKGLQMNGYQVFSAVNGSEAEQMFEKELGDFDIIFSDLVLPDISGAVLSERLKKKKSGLKVLLCSGYEDEALKSQEFRMDGCTTLQKPYTLSDVLKKINKLMNA